MSKFIGWLKLISPKKCCGCWFTCKGHSEQGPALAADVTKEAT